MLKFPRGVGRVNFYSLPSYTFQALTWEGYDTGHCNSYVDHRNYHVYVGGVDERGNSVTLITKFMPSILLSMEEDATHFIENKLLRIDEDMKGWEKEKLDLPRDEYHRRYRTFWSKKNKCKCKFRDAYVKHVAEEYSDVSKGFTGPVPAKFPFTRIYFKTQEAAKNAIWWIQKNTKAIVYDALLEPFIRMAQATEFKMAGWVKLQQGEFDKINSWDSKRLTKTDIEIHVKDWRNLLGIDYAKNAKSRVLSIDLECHARHGKFPNKDDKTNPIFQCAFYAKDVCTIMLHLGPCDDLGDKVRLIVCRSVREWLFKFVEIILALDPDIVHAYNGYGFDFPYLEAQAKLHKCWDEFQKLSRYKNQKVVLEERTMKSSGSGVNIWGILRMPGRLTYDPLVSLKTAHKEKSYTLNAMSQKFLSTELDNNPLSCTEGSPILTITQKNHGFSVCDVINLNGVATPVREEKAYTLGGWTYENYHEKLHNVSKVVSENVYEITMPTPCRQTVEAGGGNVIKVFESKHDIDFGVMNDAYIAKDSAVMATVAKYCIQDAILPQKIIDSQYILLNLIEMAKVRWTPLDYVIVRGQTIGVFSQYTRMAFKMGYVLPTRDYNAVVDDGNESFEGGLVLTPVIGYHWKRPTAVPDYSALYPSLMCDWMLGLITQVVDEQYLNLPGVTYNTEKISEKTSHTFATNVPCILREILSDMLNQRGHYKKKMKTAETPEERAIWNGAQLAVKICANSIYGACGCAPSKSIFPWLAKAVAVVTTKKGRDSTKFMRDYAIDSTNFAEIMKYNDGFMPSDWAFLCEYEPGKYTSMEVAGLKIGKTKVFGTKGYANIVSIEERDGLFKVVLDEGKCHDMTRYSCEVVYGDTDSIFTQFDCDHLEGNDQKVGYTIILAVYISKKITHQIRLNNPHVPYDEQRMELEYEKVLLYMLLFAKKRYEYVKTMFNIFKWSRYS